MGYKRCQLQRAGARVLHGPKGAIAVLFALMSLALAACGGEDLPFVGDWTIDVPASISANSGNPAMAKIIRRVASMRFNFQNDEWTMTFGETSETESHDLVAGSDSSSSCPATRAGRW